MKDIIMSLLLNCANAVGQQINDWKRILRNNLSDGFEVELRRVNFEYDENFCRELARKFSMAFLPMKEIRSGFFAKVQRPAVTR
jgi:hypothetical protein